MKGCQVKKRRRSLIGMETLMMGSRKLPRNQPRRPSVSSLPLTVAANHVSDKDSDD